VYFIVLDVFRFVFAIIIVLAHTSGWTKTFPSGGLVVDFFFVLSGFVLSHVFFQKQDKSYLKFVVSRIARLFPLYFFSLILLLGINLYMQQFPHINAYFLKNFLLIQTVLPNAGMGYNWPSWSISIEFWLNISLFFLLIQYRKYFYALVITVICYSVLFSHQLIDHANIQNIFGLPAGLYRGAAGLSLGYLSYEVYLRVLKIRFLSKIDNFWYSLLEIVLIIIVFFILKNDLLQTKIICIFLLPIFVILFALEKGVISSLFKVPGINKLGVLSYGLYLLHVPFLVLFRYLDFIPKQDIQTPIMTAIGFSILISIIAILIFWLIEQPLKLKIKRSVLVNLERTL